MLFTRPRAASEDAARRLRAQAGPHRVEISPILEIRPREMSIKVDSDAVLALSSAHAVAALQQAGQAAGQRAFCVGDATAQAARQAGLDAVSADGDAGALADLIRDRAPGGTIHWLHGAHTRGGLAESLSKDGFRVVESIVYDQVAQPLSAQARALLAGPGRVIVPLYSPRSAALVAAACAGARAALDAVFISPAAAAAWTGPEPVASTLACRKTGDSMLDALSFRIAAARAG